MREAPLLSLSPVQGSGAVFLGATASCLSVARDDNKGPSHGRGICHAAGLLVGGLACQPLAGSTATDCTKDPHCTMTAAGRTTRWAAWALGPGSSSWGLLRSRYIRLRSMWRSAGRRRLWQPADMIDSELLGAVLEGDFDKALVIRFVRNVSGKLFWGMTEMAQGLQAGMLGSVSRAAIPGRNVILRESI